MFTRQHYKVKFGLRSFHDTDRHRLVEALSCMCLGIVAGCNTLSIDSHHGHLQELLLCYALLVLLLIFCGVVHPRSMPTDMR